MLWYREPFPGGDTRPPRSTEDAGGSLGAGGQSLDGLPPETAVPGPDAAAAPGGPSALGSQRHTTGCPPGQTQPQR